MKLGSIERVEGSCVRAVVEIPSTDRIIRETWTSTCNRTDHELCFIEEFPEGSRGRFCHRKQNRVIEFEPDDPVAVRRERSEVPVLTPEHRRVWPRRPELDPGGRPTIDDDRLKSLCSQA